MTDKRFLHDQKPNLHLPVGQWTRSPTLNGLTFVASGQHHYYYTVQFGTASSSVLDLLSW